MGVSTLPLRKVALKHSPNGCAEPKMSVTAYGGLGPRQLNRLPLTGNVPTYFLKSEVMMVPKRSTTFPYYLKRYFPITNKIWKIEK